MTVLILGLLGTHSLNVDTDHFAVSAVVVVAQNLDLVESATQGLNAEALVLVVTAAVLVVQVDGAQLAELQSKCHFVSGIQTSQDSVSGFQNCANTLGILRSSGNSHNVADGAAVGTVDRLIGLGLDQNLDLVVVGQHVVDGVDQLADLLNGVLGLSTQGAFTSQPQNDVLSAHSVSDVDGALCTPHSELVVFLGVGGEAAVGGVGIHPQTRSDELSNQTVLVQGSLHVLSIINDLLLGHVVHIGHCVVIVELNAGHTDLCELLKLCLHVNGRTNAGAESLYAFVTVPGACSKLKSRHNICILSHFVKFGFRAYFLSTFILP